MPINREEDTENYYSKSMMFLDFLSNASYSMIIIDYH